MLSLSIFVASRIDQPLKRRELGDRTRPCLLDRFVELPLQLAFQLLDLPALHHAFLLQETLEHHYRVLVRPPFDFVASPVLSLVVDTVPLHPPAPALDERRPFAPPADLCGVEDCLVD